MFEFILPDLGEGIHEGELLVWHVKEGDHVNEDDPLCDMETDKATVTIPSPRTGTVAKLNGSPGDTMKVGQVLVVIDDGSAETAGRPGQEKTAEKTEAPSPPPAAGKNKVAAAPATRRLARELGIDITTVNGTGPGGKVLPEDVKAAVQGTAEDAAGPEPADTEVDEPLPDAVSGRGIPFFQTDPLPDFSAAGPVEVIPIRSLRKKVAVKTTTSAVTIPHVAHMEEWDVTQMESLRRDLNRKETNKLTLLSFVVKAAAVLLKTYPEFNASVDADKMQIIHKKYIHIGFAADTPKGLMVPVVRHADQKNIVEIARDIRTLAEKGQDGTIDAADLSGSTFTVTNVGVIGGTGVFPIINYPESAILGMGRVGPKPVAVDDKVVIRTMLPATLCFDHRVADGVKAAKFMRDMKKRLEDPTVFLTRV